MFQKNPSIKTTYDLKVLVVSIYGEKGAGTGIDILIPTFKLTEIGKNQDKDIHTNKGIGRKAGMVHNGFEVHTDKIARQFYSLLQKIIWGIKKKKFLFYTLFYSPEF